MRKAFQRPEIQHWCGFGGSDADQAHPREIALADLNDTLETGQEDFLRVNDHLGIDAHCIFLELAIGFRVCLLYTSPSPRD